MWFLGEPAGVVSHITYTLYGFAQASWNTQMTRLLLLLQRLFQTCIDPKFKMFNLNNLYYFIAFPFSNYNTTSLENKIRLHIKLYSIHMFKDIPFKAVNLGFIKM